MAENLLEWLSLPKKDPVPRMLISPSPTNYLFYLAVAESSTLTGRKAKFLVKSDEYTDNEVRSIVEEPPLSVFGTPPVYALTGFSPSFVRRLRIPKDNYLVALVAEGDWYQPSFPTHRKRLVTQLLKVLYRHVDLDREKKLRVRDLARLDYSQFDRVELIEPFLRKADLMGWDLETVKEMLEKTDSINVLVALKRDTKAIMDWAESTSHTSAIRVILNRLAGMAQYRLFKEAGMENWRIAKELGIRTYLVSSYEEALPLWPEDDLREAVLMATQMGTLFTREPERALLIYASEIRL